MKIVVRSWSLMFLFFLIGQLSSYFANSWRIFRLNACFLPRTDVNQCSQGQLQIWAEYSPIQIPLRGRIGKTKLVFLRLRKKRSS